MDESSKEQAVETLMGQNRSSSAVIECLLRLAIETYGEEAVVDAFYESLIRRDRLAHFESTRRATQSLDALLRKHGHYE